MILTDLSKSNRTGLVLSRAAFAAMARHGMAKELEKLGRVDVEYKRQVISIIQFSAERKSEH